MGFTHLEDVVVTQARQARPDTDDDTDTDDDIDTDDVNVVNTDVLDLFKLIHLGEHPQSYCKQSERASSSSSATATKAST